MSSQALPCWDGNWFALTYCLCPDINLQGHQRMEINSFHFGEARYVMAAWACGLYRPSLCLPQVPYTGQPNRRSFWTKRRCSTSLHWFHLFALIQLSILGPFECVQSESWTIQNISNLLTWQNGATSIYGEMPMADLYNAPFHDLFMSASRKVTPLLPRKHTLIYSNYTNWISLPKEPLIKSFVVKICKSLCLPDKSLG